MSDACDTKLYKEAHNFNVYKMLRYEVHDRTANTALVLNLTRVYIQSCGGSLGGIGGMTMINVRLELS